jgi:hypothetical protein
VKNKTVANRKGNQEKQAKSDKNAARENGLELSFLLQTTPPLVYQAFPF